MALKLLMTIVAWTMLSGAAQAETIQAETNQARTITVGLSGSFTGSLVSMGVSLREGVRLAVAAINQAGGVMGKQIVLAERDDQGSVEQGEQNAQQLVHLPVVATVGFVDTDVAMAAQRYYEEAEIPVLNAVATGVEISRQFMPPRKANYIFQTSLNDAGQAALIAREAISRRHFKAPAILADSTDYGRAGRDLLTKELNDLRTSPAAVETFNIGDTDMGDQLARINRADADVILTFGKPPELVQIVNSMAKLGWKLPIIGSWTLGTETFISGARLNGEGVSMPQTFIQNGDTPGRAAFVSAYWRVFRARRMDCPPAAAQGFDSVYLLKAAIEQAGSTAGPAIRAALERLRTKVNGVVTVYDQPFSPTDHEALSPNIAVFGMVANRHVTLAHEEDLAGDHVVRVKQ